MREFRLLRNEVLAPGYHRLTFEGKLTGRPGQFLMVRAWEGYDPLLARPFSLHELHEASFSILFQVRGRGTSYLSQLKPGAKVEILGPLGRGFPPPSEGPLILVAGGIGIAPFKFLAKEYIPGEIILFYGARSAKDLIISDEFKALGVEVFLATEDGSTGFSGLVTEPLGDFLKQNPKCTIYACGPTPMLKAVAKIAKELGLKAFVSLEARMACGLGMCLGCTVPTKGEGFLHVCTEGPVVAAEQVF